ncbi:MAG TPA: hypothetical protein VIY96_06940 [Thermoanaerobaculia bacterium]
MRKTLLTALLASFCAIVFSSAAALAADNWIGTWKLNTAKSRFKPGPAPKSLTLKWEATADGVRHTSDGVGSDGNPTHGTYVTKYDGQDVPWEGNPDADMASARKISANSYRNVWKKDGKTTITAKVVVSNKGKILTVTQVGKNAKGQAVNNRLVYDRQ